MSFTFATAGRIVFGSGQLKNLDTHLLAALGAPPRGKKALVITGSRKERAEPLAIALAQLDVTTRVVPTMGEPTITDAESALSEGRSLGADFVCAIGGGSAIDLAKIVALLLENEGGALDYLEVIGKGRTPAHPALPVIALPTTSGTGAEVTKNGVLQSEEHRVKVSLRHESMLPRLALVDPELTLSVPPDVTAATGLDALTQCIEPFLSCFAHPLTDAVAREGMTSGAQSLRAAVEDGANLPAREGMAICSLFGGLSLANAKLGAVHGFAGPFGGMFRSPHGAVCARLLPLVLEENLRALRSRAPGSPALPRFDEVARILTGDPGAAAEDGIDWVGRLVEDLRIPRLRDYGMAGRDVEGLAEQSERSSSMKGNPIPLTRGELTSILEKAL